MSGIRPAAESLVKRGLALMEKNAEGMWVAGNKLLKADKGKKMAGYVISNKMKKSVTVGVMRTYEHPLLKIPMRKVKKVRAHDETDSLKEGAFVEIRECNYPEWKNKRFVATHLLRDAPEEIKLVEYEHEKPKRLSKKERK
eukprot:Nk52_evm69s1073 gene=Nk52_evmTU69s1073